MSNGRLGDLLVAKGVINADQLRAAEDYKTKNKSRLTSSLVKLGHVNEGVLATFLSQQYGITAISLDDVQVPPAVAKLVPKNLCEKHLFVPLGSENGILSIAISDPTNVAAVDDIRFLCNMEVSVYLATETSIRKLVEKVYPAGAAPATGGPAAKTEGVPAKAGGPAKTAPKAPEPSGGHQQTDAKATISLDDMDFEDKTTIVEISKEKKRTKSNRTSGTKSRSLKLSTSCSSSPSSVSAATFILNLTSNISAFDSVSTVACMR